jgi:hypothetical protein
MRADDLPPLIGCNGSHLFDIGVVDREFAVFIILFCVPKFFSGTTIEAIL